MTAESDRRPAESANVLAYGGHRLREDEIAEVEIKSALCNVLDARAIGVGYGSLAAGGDILWAETLLERGADVHVTLPFAPDRFVDTSVRPSGAGWVVRFGAVRSCAMSLTILDPTPGSTKQAYRAAADTVFARAAAAARRLSAQVTLGVIWDGTEGNGVAGTAADLAKWRSLGLPYDVVPISRRRAGR